MKKTYVLAHAEARRRAVQAIHDAPDGMVITISEPTRNLEQNAALWALLSEISNQVVWHGRKLDAGSWKHIFSSSLKKQDVVPNLDNTGFVVLGQSTSNMSKREFSDLLELIYSFAAEYGVVFGDERMAA